MFFARISTARGSVFGLLEVIGEDCAIVEIPPFDGWPVLDRAPHISKNDAEVLELGEPPKTRQKRSVPCGRRESSFALRRERLNRLAGLYAQTGKKQPKWLNMF
jgi:hypothetical protein